MNVKTIKIWNVQFVYSLRIFCLCSRYNNINYCAWHVHKPLFGSSVAIGRLTCSEISLSIKGKKLEISPGKGRTYYNLADGVTALAQLYTLIEHALSTNDSARYIRTFLW